MSNPSSPPITNTSAREEIDSVYRNILYFIYLIRKAGITISTAEIIDALNALNFVSLLNKEHVRTVLRVTLVKDSSSLTIFENAFAFFFAPIDLHSQIVEEKMQQRQQRQTLITNSSEDLEFQGEQLNLTDEQIIAYANLEEEEQQNIRDFLERASGGANVRESFRPIIQNMVSGKLNQQKTRLENLGKDLSNPFSNEQREVQAALDAITDSVREKENSVFNTDMSKINDEELREAIILINHFTRKLAVLINRKYRQSNKKNKLDFKRTIHVSVRYGGIPIHLKYKKHSVEKPRVIFICDVSGSMHQYSRFLMLLMYGMSNALDSLEGFVFSDSSEKISHLMRQAKRTTPEQMLETVSLSPYWGGTTNFNTALGNILNRHSFDFHKNTIVLIYSDGKTEQHQQAAEKMAVIRQRVKKIIWLNPVKQTDWNKIPQIENIKKHCSMLECTTLSSLQHIIKKQFEALNI
jgi:hypothetical protein